VAKKPVSPLCWLERSVAFGPCYAVIVREEDFRAEAKRLGEPDLPWITAKQCARCYHLQHSAGGRVVLVAINLEHEAHKEDPEEILITLCHEAVHVYQEWREMLQGDDVGRELEAQAIENFTRQLWRGYRAECERLKIEDRTKDAK
jgi:hypothetical protein